LRGLPAGVPSLFAAGQTVFSIRSLLKHQSTMGLKPRQRRQGLPGGQPPEITKASRESEKNSSGQGPQTETLQAIVIHDRTSIGSVHAPPAGRIEKVILYL
jgi:hypothetical protein